MLGHKAIWAEAETMSPGTSEQRKKSSEVQRHDFVPLGYSTTPKLVNKTPEYREYEYDIGSMDRTLMSESVTKSPESGMRYYYMSNTEQETKHHRIEESSILTSGYSTTPKLVNKTPEYREYEYDIGSMDRTLMSESVTKSPELSVHYPSMSNAEQETKHHRIEESSILTSGYSTTPKLVNKTSEYREYEYDIGSMDRTLMSESVTKSPESSVHYSYMSNTEQETKHHRIEESSILTSVEPPDIASGGKTKTRSPDSVSRSLLVVSEFPFEQQQLVSLLNLIPGLMSCEISHGLYSSRVYAVVQYNNAASAIYAKHKLHGFEYPLRNWLIVTFIEEGTVQRSLTKPLTKQKSSMVRSSSSFHLQGASSSFNRLQIDAKLPSSQRKTPSDSSVQERLYITFNPYPLPQDILEDILSRFGHFISVHFIPEENTACSLFAERASVIDAIAALHGKTVNGVKLEMKLAVSPKETPVNAKGLSDQVSHFKTAQGNQYVT